MPHRRATDRCLAKRMWDMATPYAQVGGFFTVAIPILYSAFLLYQTVQTTSAAADDYYQFKSDMQTRVAVQEQTNERMARQVDAIYAHLVEGKKK